MLHNEIYIGKLRWKGYVVDAIHDPIIDNLTFCEVEKLLIGRGRKRQKVRTSS